MKRVAGKVQSFVAAGLLVVALVGMASASSLSLQHPSTLHTGGAARCSTSQVRVTLSNPLLVGHTTATFTRPAGCSQGTVTIYAQDNVGTHTATADAGQTTATFDSRMWLFTVKSVLVTINTWVMPTSWQ